MVFKNLDGNSPFYHRSRIYIPFYIFKRLDSNAGYSQELCSTFQLAITTALTHSTVFEDNKVCVDLIAAPTMRPRTRHIAIKYHHFREHVRTGQIRIKWISTSDQLADIFTKPLPLSKFTTIHQKLLGW
jgi:hypothetical protein